MPNFRTLVLGWGNPGRGDDGLGPALAGIIEAQADDGLTVESDYQLQVEDAAEIARHDRVVFVDADRSGPEPFSCRRLAPAETGLSFTSHSVSPEALLKLTGELFGREPETWLVGIRGYDFDTFDETLSPRARANLAATAGFLSDALRDGCFEERPGPGRSESTCGGRPADSEDVK
ncbi:MAG: hydrogenase maturation protease [bacterium]|nr:hydrogenase maturation protease [bacterium]